MARAGIVPGVRPRRSLADNAPTFIEVRLQEVLSWRSALDDAALVDELHDLRIAAKRLRYALEMFDSCFEGSKALLKELTEIQDDVGTIHDLDVLVTVLRDRLAQLEAPREELSIAIMSQDLSAEIKDQEMREMLRGQTADPQMIGLVSLIAETIVDRRRRYVAFQQRWAAGALEAFAAHVRAEIGTQSPAAIGNEPTRGRDQQDPSAVI